jgi:hypothetical protein
MAEQFANLPGIILKIQDSSSPDGYRRQYFNADLKRVILNGRQCIEVDYEAIAFRVLDLVTDPKIHPKDSPSIFFRRGDGVLLTFSAEDLLMAFAMKSSIFLRAECGVEVWHAAKDE